MVLPHSNDPPPVPFISLPPRSTETPLQSPCVSDCDHQADQTAFAHLFACATNSRKGLSRKSGSSVHWIGRERYGIGRRGESDVFCAMGCGVSKDDDDDGTSKRAMDQKADILRAANTTFARTVCRPESETHSPRCGNSLTPPILSLILLEPSHRPWGS